MDSGLKEKIERWKATAEIFVKNNTKAFIKEVSGDIYFCEILLVGEDSLRILCFAPERRAGYKYTIYWPLVIALEEYKEVSE